MRRGWRASPNELRGYIRAWTKTWGSELPTLDIDTPAVTAEIKGLQSSLLTQGLGLINVLVASVIPRPGISLGVLVLHNAPEGVQNRL